ncbi:hypothetical protein SPHFLASMR4Y_01799 [Sphingorhabdus sp. SMR4y]|nr:hypothetical protein SPHFLASMR4Y_01799 [Sphingorhabdus sp. SMR4y]
MMFGSNPLVVNLSNYAFRREKPFDRLRTNGNNIRSS